MKNKKSNCVELNIYVECNKCSHYEESSPCEYEEKHEDDNNDETCVKINVFAECDKNKW